MPGGREPGDVGPSALRRDRVGNSAVTLLYALSLGMAGIGFPLLALDAGYDAATIGVVVGLSAVAQLVGRLGMSSLLRAVPDKHLIVASAVLLAASSAAVVVSTALAVLVASQLVQGLSRALFWTSNQTHAVRAEESAVRPLAGLNLWTGIGSLAGPVLCGAIAAVVSIDAAIAVSAVVAALALLPAALLVGFRPFRRVPVDPAATGVPRALWLRPAVLTGCLLAATAGVWRGLLNSYVPVALVAAAHDEAVVGVLAAVASGAGLLATPLSRIAARGPAVAVIASVVPTAVGLAVVGLVPGPVALAAIGLFVSGVGGGLAQTLGPALASEAVHPEERGRSIAATGTARAITLLATPFAAAGLVVALPASLTVAVVAVVGAVPALLLLPRLRGR